jgi:hypothetical protein
MDLQHSLSKCHQASAANKRRVLSYLIPIQIAHGRLPTAALLSKYQFHEYR